MNRYFVTALGHGASVTNTYYAHSRTAAAQLARARFLEVNGRYPTVVQVEECTP